MDPLIAGAIGLIGFAILMVAIAWKRWTNTTESFSRVEALRALVAESSALAGPRATAPPVADPEEHGDLALRPVPRAGAVGSATHQFVVTVPDTPAASPSHLSFQRTESRT